MGGDPAAPITPSQIGIPLLISTRKKKECLSSASRHQSCAAGSTTAAMLLRNMQSDGTAQVLAVCTIRYTTREREKHGQLQVQVADCRLQVTGAWNLRPMRVVILPLHMNSEWINGETEQMDRWPTCTRRKSRHGGPSEGVMKIAHTRALVVHKPRAHQHSEGFCGLQSVGPRNKTPSSVCLCPAPTHVWKISLLASCRLIRHMDAERSRLARPYMRALGPVVTSVFFWFRIACSRPG